MKGTSNGNHPAQDDVLKELFQHATARQRPQASDEQEIRDAVYLQWREINKRRKRRRIIISLAAAASLVLALFVGHQLQQPALLPDLSVPLASVEKIHGRVFVHPPGEGSVSRLDTLATVLSGQQIVTGLESRVALRWRDGSSIRMDQNSEIRLEPNGVISLVAGQLYVDSGAAQISPKPLIIMTSAGAIRHLGTQYMTRYQNGETRLSVREGSAAIEIDGVNFVATRGEQLIVESSGTRARQQIEGYGELWEWTQSLAPGFQLDGRTVADFLHFVAHESGRAIEFASPRAQQIAAETQLRGHVEVEPFHSMQTVLQTTELKTQIRGGEIIVTLRQ